MKELLALAGAHKAVTALVVAGVVAGGGVAVAAADRPTTATVTKVVDGDTIDVRYGGEEHRVRLLNIDTPESVDPNASVECLGPEASDWLERRLPVGTQVRLERDVDTRDRYGRELAAVFVGDELVNAEIARVGMGIAVSYGSNTKFLPPVRAAQAEAERAGRGLYSSVVECTIPAQVDQLVTEASDTVAETPAAAAALGDFDDHAAQLAAVLATSKALLGRLDGDVSALPLLAHRDRIGNFRSQVTTVQDRVAAARTANSTARTARQQQLDAEARRAAEEAARQEAARLAAEEAARRAAEEAARQEAAERAAAAARAAQESYRPPAPSTATRTQAPAPSTGGSGPSGYTGCRSYAPGGKTWTPIPC